MRTIMLIDMDYFFAACEEIKRPELKTRPTIVGADPKEGRGRGVVMTCNYVARKFGIHSAMPISQAYKLKPDAEYLPMDYSYYEKKSAEVLSIIREFAGRVEQVSIDEFFIDVSEKTATYDEALAYAKKIKEEINEKAKLPCSIGISNTKLVAKMACEKAKPNGIKLVKEEEAKAFLAPLPVGQLYGIGSKTEERLGKMGYKTVAELSKVSMMKLMGEFGSFGIDIHNCSNAIDESEVVENNEIKSISREFTFEHDTKKLEQVIKEISELSKQVGKDIEERKLSFKVVTLKLRYSDFIEHLHSRSIRPTNVFEEIEKNAVELYKENVEKEKKVRKLGVRVSGFTDYKSQKRLF